MPPVLLTANENGTFTGIAAGQPAVMVMAGW